MTTNLDLYITWLLEFFNVMKEINTHQNWPVFVSSLYEAQHPVLIASDNIHLNFLVWDLRNCTTVLEKYSLVRWVTWLLRNNHKEWCPHLDIDNLVMNNVQFVWHDDTGNVLPNWFNFLQDLQHKE